MSAELEVATGLSSILESAGIAFEDDAGQLRIPARHVAVGDLLITFDDGEITVFVGNFTHRHFTPREATAICAASTIEDCMKDAAEFVSGILDDQWILWAYPGGTGGSYRVGGEGNPMEDTPLPEEEVVRFLWSGPLDSRDSKSLERKREH